MGSIPIFCKQLQQGKKLKEVSETENEKEKDQIILKNESRKDLPEIENIEENFDDENYDIDEKKEENEEDEIIFENNDNEKCENNENDDNEIIKKANSAEILEKFLVARGADLESKGKKVVIERKNNALIERKKSAFRELKKKSVSDSHNDVMAAFGVQ